MPDAAHPESFLLPRVSTGLVSVVVMKASSFFLVFQAHFYTLGLLQHRYFFFGFFFFFHAGKHNQGFSRIYCLKKKKGTRREEVEGRNVKKKKKKKKKKKTKMLKMESFWELLKGKKKKNV